MLTFVQWILVASVIPRVEDPWPASIGLEFPFTMGGVGTVMAGLIYAEASQPRRDRASHKGGLCGFGVGALIYTLSLLNQVAFGL